MTGVQKKIHMSMRSIPRTAPVGVRVMAYRNLHKACWSLKDMKTGRVIAHLDEVYISDADFRVSQAGRNRVLMEKTKNVHAGVVGTVILAKNDREAASWIEVRYNPYRYSTFVRAGDSSPVHRADVVHLSNTGRAFALCDSSPDGEKSWTTESQPQPLSSSS